MLKNGLTKMKTAINIGQITAREIIKILGGGAAVANLLQIRPASVSEWTVRNSIPDDKLIRLAVCLESVTKEEISRRDLFPEDWMKIWPELAEPEKQCSCVNE